MADIIESTMPKDGNIVRLLNDFESEANGKSTITSPHEMLNRMIGGGFRRGLTSIVAGPPGNGKSFFAYNQVLHMLLRNQKVKYLPLEYTAVNHIRRIMGVYVGSWGMINDTPEKAQERTDAFMKNSSMIFKFNEIEKNILENPTNIQLDEDGRPYIPSVDYNAIMEVVRHYSQTEDMIIIDPITAIDPKKGDGKGYEQQEKFVKDISATAAYYKTHIMLIGHTVRRQKHNGKPTALTNDDIAGTIALARFTQYMLLVDYHDSRESSVENRSMMKTTVDHKRTMFIGKATYGCGTGQKIAFEFDHGPNLEELGVIQND